MKRKSKDFRETAVLAVVNHELTIAQVISAFKISKSTIYLWVKTYKQEGRLEHKRIPGKKGKFDESQMQELKELVQQQPDMTLAEIAEHFGNIVSLATIHNYLAKMGLRFKKNTKGGRAESKRR